VDASGQRRWVGTIRMDTSVRPASSFIEPVHPDQSGTCTGGAEFVYEIKHDGYRLPVRKHEGRVRISRRPILRNASRASSRPGLADFGRHGDELTERHLSGPLRADVRAQRFQPGRMSSRNIALNEQRWRSKRKPTAASAYRVAVGKNKN
jgi:hypothetical protein